MLVSKAYSTTVRLEVSSLGMLSMRILERFARWPFWFSDDIG